MQIVKKYPNNTFSWIDLNSSNQKGATAFYTSLFGWEVDERPIGDGQTYTMLKHKGEDVCAISQMRPEEMAAEHPSYWSSYINVYDIEETLQKVKEAGGTIEVPTFDVMGEGDMAVIKDPAGAFVSLWKAKNHIGASAVNMPNTWTWNELLCPDTEKAKAFYTAVFDWTTEVDAPSGYVSFKREGRFIAGLMSMEGLPPHWSIYFGVENCQEVADEVVKLGGAVLRPPFDAGETGIIAVLTDPYGGSFNIIQANYYEEPPNA